MSRRDGVHGHVAPTGKGLAPHQAPVLRQGPGSDPGATRFFQIGFPRCGTSALAAFFNRCGIPCVDFDRGRLARRMRENLAAGRAPLEGYDHRYLAFTNMDFQTPHDHFDGFRHFDALMVTYGGKYILNTRPVDHWLASKLRRSARKRWQATHAARFGAGDPASVAECLQAEWEAHHRRVRAGIPPDRLLVFDIESDPPERLCDFVGVPRSCARHFRPENPAPNALGELLDAWLPRPLKATAPDWIKLPAKRLLRRRSRAKGASK